MSLSLSCDEDNHMNKSIGILGGGQLGKMLYHAGNQYDIELNFMDQMEHGPVSRITPNYQIGDITSIQDVVTFGSNLDIVSIEIEKVNIDALFQLEEKGVKVYPQAHVIASIQDKGLQKRFYLDHNLPTAPFKQYDNLSSLLNDLDKGLLEFPFIQKMRKDGYDGRGVQILRSEQDLDKAFPYNFITEKRIDIDKELAVITCSDIQGNVVMYDPVEMVFHPDKNILLYQLSPAQITQEQSVQMKNIATKVTEAFGIVGLLAIEFFLTRSGDILINEVAPRPHNSGHHTIEASSTSQYENHLRAIAGMPLGAADTLSPSLLINLLGAEGYTGSVVYQGIEQVRSMDNVHVHTYGKIMTKPYRKMGHINILGKDHAMLIKKYKRILENIKVISES